MRSVILLFLIAAPACWASNNQVQTAANPIRRVVTMLQMMTKKIETESEKEKELYEKFMCWCSSGAGALSDSIAAAETKAPQVSSAISEGEASLVQTKADLKAAQTGRSDAKSAMAEATAIRDKENAVFVKDSTDAKTNIAALTKAVNAIETGMGGAFLQTTAATKLKQLTVDSTSLSDFDRNLLVSFLAQGQGYAPQSGQITGILKQMGDTMASDLAEITAAEKAAAGTFGELIAAKSKEVAALTKSIETKTIRIGSLGVEIAQMKGDLDDTQKALLEDKKFLADMEGICAAKKAEWAETTKMRGLELAAIADTIEMLNSDDALELFKKTLPGASASFVQTVSSSAQSHLQALKLIKGARGHRAVNRIPLDLITMALMGKKVDMSKVSKMVDELIGVLNKEQTDDTDKKEYCETQIDSLDDKKKVLQQDVSDLGTLIEDTKEKLATTKSELEALAAGIKKLDKDVAEATEQRKEENSDYSALMASDTAAKELIGMAKNRMNKFYNPAQYEAPPKRELTDEERAMSTVAFVQISLHKGDEAPAPPPAAPKAYAKNAEGGTGVLTMMDMLVADLDKEMQEAEVNEKNAQEEYEEFMSDSAAKRADDSSTITDKEGAKADMEVAIEEASKSETSKVKELMATEEVLSGVHGECDWLLNNFDARKAARSGEIESLKKAKAVLAGADFSFVQTALRGSRA